MEQRLYYSDSYLTAFQARVVSCQEGKKGFAIELDQTAFYPEGGGQPSDTGTLGAVEVTQVHEKDGAIIHYCTGPVEVGQTVNGRIDWTRRFDFMQQHSGEHIVSGLIHQMYGYDNVGFHLGSDTVTIDFNGMISQAGLQEIETKANEVIWSNVALEITFPDAETLKTLEYRSKKELSGQVRIVRVPTADVCACCGTHVARTGEVGAIKILSCQKFHDGVRLEMVCGRRALSYFQTIFEQNHRNAVLLSAKMCQTAQVVQKLHDDFAAAKAHIGDLEETVFSQRAAELEAQGDVLLFEAGLSADSVRRLASKVVKSCGGRCAVFSGTDAEGYKYCIAENGGDLRSLVKDLNSLLSGRGGGKPDFAQGSVQAARAQIQEFFQNR